MPGRATAFRHRTPGVSRWANPRWLPEGRHRFDYHGVEVGPLGRAEACGKEQPGRPALRPRFAPPTGEQRRHQPPGELINEHQAAAGPEDPGALVRPACWSDQWSNDVVLTTRSKVPAGNESRSADPVVNFSRGSPTEDAATPTIAGEGSTPVSSSAVGQRPARTRSRYPVPQPMSRMCRGSGERSSASAAVRSAIS